MLCVFVDKQCVAGLTSTKLSSREMTVVERDANPEVEERKAKYRLRMAESDLQAAYGVDQKKKPGYALVYIKAKGLKVKKAGVFTSKMVPKNATLTTDFQTQSFKIELKAEKGALKEENISLHIKRLPHEIIPASSYAKVEEDAVIVYLCKEDEDLKWNCDEGLETAEDGDDNANDN